SDSVAEHDLVSEVYHIIDGSATLVTSPEIVGMKRRPATLETVRLFNGPGNNGSSVRNGVTHELKAGDVVVIPAGTGHWFTKIYVVHRCFENSCAGRPEAPILKFDSSGKLLKSWGAGAYVFPHGLHVDAQGNVWVTDAQGKDGQGHQVFKYDANGTLLMTIGR